MTSTRTTAAVVTLVAAALALSACTAPASEPSSSPVDGGTLTFAEPSDTAEMDPQVSYFDTSWRIQDLVYDSLVTTDASSQILPSIAESWTEEGNVYTFTLREGVTFSNGRALEADDVVGSLERLLDPATASYFAGQLGPVEAVTAVDAKTVRIQMTTPWAPLLPALASTSAAILPIKELNDGSFDPAAEMLGTGPFMLEDHVQDQQWTLTANPDYWAADDLQLDGVNVRIIPDDAARVAALRDGSVDIASFANPDAPTLLQGIPQVATTVQGSSDMYWLILNSVAPGSSFAEENVRQAVATAVDRDALVATALGGQGLPTAVTPAGLEGSCTPDGLPTYTSSADDAAALLGGSTLSYDLISPPYLTTFSALAQVIQQGQADAGIDVTIEKPEMGSYIDRVYVQIPGQFDAVIDYFSGFIYPTMAAQYLDVAPGGGGSLTGMVTPIAGLHEALATANTSTDADERAAAVEQVCELVATSANVIPLATKSTTIGVRTDQVDAEIPDFDGYDVYYRNILDYVMLG